MFTPLTSCFTIRFKVLNAMIIFKHSIEVRKVSKDSNLVKINTKIKLRQKRLKIQSCATHVT